MGDGSGLGVADGIGLGLGLGVDVAGARVGSVVCVAVGALAVSVVPNLAATWVSRNG